MPPSDDPGQAQAGQAPAAASPAAAPPGTGSDAGQAETLSARVSRLEQLLERLVNQGHQAAATHTEHKLDRPSNVEEQVRAELAKAKAEQDAAAADEGRKREVDDLKSQVAQLRETPPATPVRRIERAMWGRRG